MTAPRSVCSTSASTSMRLTISLRSISLEQAVQVDPVQHVVQIDLVQQRVHVQRGNHKLYHTIGGGLRPLLRARDQPALRQKPSLR